MCAADALCPILSLSYVVVIVEVVLEAALVLALVVVVVDVVVAGAGLIRLLTG